MDGDTPSNDTPQAPTSEPAATPQAPGLSPEIQAIIDTEKRKAAEQAHNSARAAARKKYEAQPQHRGEPAPQPEPAPAARQAAPQQTEDTEAIVDRRVTLGRLSERYKLNGAQESTISRLARLDAPPDLATWFERQVGELFGIKAPNGSNGAQPAHVPSGASSVTQANPNIVPSLTPSAVSTAVPLERAVDILDMSQEQVHEMLRKQGGDPSRPYSPKNRGPRRAIRQQTDAALARRTIVVTK